MLQIQSKVIFCIIWPIVIAVVAFVSPTTCAPTSTSTLPVEIYKSQQNNNTYDFKGNNHSKKDLNQYNATPESQSIDDIQKYTKEGYKSLLHKQIGSQLLDKYNKDFSDNTNNKINDNPVDQLTELSKAKNISQIKDNLISNELRESNTVDTKQIRLTPSDYQKGLKQNRYKRSHYRTLNSLHSNLDDLLNIRRERRALRFKRNTNYEDFLASLATLAKEQEESDNYNTYPILSNDINIVPVSQALYSLLQNRYDLDDNGYVDLDKLNQYYYPNNIPIVEIDNNGETSTGDDDINQELPAFIQPYAQHVIPVLPYTLPSNRYQRIRKSYYRKYHNPISIYSGLRRKKSADNYYYDTDSDLGQWGRIVADRSNQNAYEDSNDEANKIYSLASILASTETTPDELNEYSKRYKRSTKSNIKFM